jgi:hypothetical protein
MIDGLIKYLEGQKISLVEDLITIASKNLEDLYRPGEEPVDGCCLAFFSKSMLVSVSSSSKYCHA